MHSFLMASPRLGHREDYVLTRLACYRKSDCHIKEVYKINNDDTGAVLSRITCYRGRCVNEVYSLSRVVLNNDSYLLLGRVNEVTVY